MTEEQLLIEHRAELASGSFNDDARVVTDAMVRAALQAWHLYWDSMKMSDSYSMREAINAALAQMEYENSCIGPRDGNEEC